MGDYLALQIEKGKLDYTAVIERYGQFKEAIDTKLIKDGYDQLIVD